MILVEMRCNRCGQGEERGKFKATLRNIDRVNTIG